MNDPNNPEPRKGFIARVWTFLWRPSSRFSLATLLIVGGIGGIIFWGSFNWAMELTNTEAFCISCHEMRDNVYKELQQTIHFKNRSGVRAICSDCHVPHEWFYKVRRKIQASNEVFHKILGTVRHAGKIRTAPARTRPARLGYDESERFARMPQLSLGRRRWTRTSRPKPAQKAMAGGVQGRS